MIHAAQTRPTANARPITGAQAHLRDASDATAKVMSLPRVTRVTQNSSDSLRARARRASNETYVTQVLSMLTSDTSDTKLQLSAPLRAHALAVLLNKTRVTSVTRLESGPEMKQAALFPAPKKAPKKPGQDEWLKQLLETKTGGFRAARWQRCPKCDQLTLHGMDADICAGMVTADPTPITPLQELACFIVNRPTYTLKPREKGYELADRRCDYLWGPRPPDHRTKIVIPAHKCGARFPGFIPRPTTKETTNEQPHF